MSTQQAFFNICADATPAKASYVSLYADVSYYGGAEEGGWWGHDTVLVAYHQCSNDVESEAVKAAVDKLADEMTSDAKKAFGEYCRESLEQAESRGLFAEDLPEVDGAESYFVTIEDRPGSQVSEGSRHYE